MLKTPKPPTQAQPVTADAPLEEGHELRMGLFDHLNELRQRLTKAMLAVVIGTIFAVFLTVPVLEYVQSPYCRIRGADAGACEFVVLDPTGGVVIYFRIALMLGAILAIPVITYQLLMFIVPGLTHRERRYIIMSLPAVTVLFLIGVAFSWFLLMPPALGFLESFQPTLFRPEWTADGYIGFVTALLFWMGVAFETPLVFFVLSLLGLVSASPLIRNWRVAVVGASIAAALITPTIDPVNMFLVMGPLLALYVISILLVFIGRRIARVD